MLSRPEGIVEDLAEKAVSEQSLHTLSLYAAVRHTLQYSALPGIVKKKVEHNVYRD
jgi:hypothetical protein